MNKIICLKIHVVAIFCMAMASAIVPLDEYVSSPEPAYKWEKLNDATFKSTFGNTVHVLNVTSLDWLDKSRAQGRAGTTWTHLVYVIIPKEIKYHNVSNAYITGGDNKHPNNVSGPFNEDVIFTDALAKYSGQVSIAIKQIPNAPIVFPSDPDQKERSSDAILAWAWYQFMEDPKKDPEWLPRLPMVKAAFQCMRAAEEFLSTNGIAHIEGWVASGASKRGWTTWDVGVTRCSSCVKILGIAPLVPVVPTLHEEMHRMWQAYGGFTWAFDDYTAVNLTENIDSPEWAALSQVIDPINYMDRLNEIPKFAVLASDDEFLMFDWTNIWYDKLGGEKHLLITPNAEHTLVTNILDVITSITTFMRSIAQGINTRPSFNYTFNESDGQIAVQMLESNLVKPKKVSLRYAQTLSTKRRDFRWIFQSNERTEPCKLPYIPVPKKLMDGHGDLCIAPIIWREKTLKEESPGVYKALPPKPRDGHWMGYYIEVEFPGDVPGGDLLFKNHILLTTPGWTWPNTLPYSDCSGSECKGILV